jgi:hypothetical protein
VVDYSLPLINGMEVQLRARLQTEILIFTMCDTESVVEA